MPNTKPGEKLIRLKISKTLQKKIREGYPWVFDYQILDTTNSGESGDLAVIYDKNNRFLAIGLYDPDSAIRVRILQTREPVPINQGFFQNRFLRSWEGRRFLEKSKTTGYRIVNGENDGLPGLIVDRYADTLVLKIYTSAWFRHLDSLIRMVKNNLFPKRCILRLSRNISNASFQDGQILLGPDFDGCVYFQENGLEFQADVLCGQKTGFYFDQRNNRFQIKKMSENKSVLNVFSYSGGFSVYAFSGGCRYVYEIEANPAALEAARDNVYLNFPKLRGQSNRFRQFQKDAFDQLSEFAQIKQSFELVILDPPAFAMRKNQKSKALKAYCKLAEAGARVTKTGGTLFVASCSNPIKNKDFYRSVNRGIERSGRRGREILKTGQPEDHPVRFKEGQYLKAGFWEILPPRDGTKPEIKRGKSKIGR